MIRGRKHRVINCDCLSFLRPKQPKVDVIFADPPDNIGLKYGTCNDNMGKRYYMEAISEYLYTFVTRARTTWLSFNPKWIADVGHIVREDVMYWFSSQIEFKPCVQVFTFGQNNKHDLGVGHRPLWRLKWKDAPLYPDNIKVESCRQKNGDKRAAPGGRVPLDVFDFPRVTGNSKQRRSWCPTQLHEGLVERCIKLSTKRGGTVLDPFGGSGTTMRVCKRIGRSCTILEVDPDYASRIAEENELKVET